MPSWLASLPWMTLAYRLALFIRVAFPVLARSVSLGEFSVMARSCRMVILAAMARFKTLGIFAIMARSSSPGVLCYMARFYRTVIFAVLARLPRMGIFFVMARSLITGGLFSLATSLCAECVGRPSARSIACAVTFPPSLPVDRNCSLDSSTRPLVLPCQSAPAARRAAGDALGY